MYRIAVLTDNMDFALHAYRMKAEYFMMMPVTCNGLRAGLFVWEGRWEALHRKERLRT